MVHLRQMEWIDKFFLNKWFQATTLNVIHLQIKEIQNFLNFLYSFVTTIDIYFGNQDIPRAIPDLHREPLSKPYLEKSH